MEFVLLKESESRLFQHYCSHERIKVTDNWLSEATKSILLFAVYINI